MEMSETELNRLKSRGIIVEFHNILATRVVFPPSMSREEIINVTIGLVLTLDYECHIIETLGDNSIRLTVNSDS